MDTFVESSWYFARYVSPRDATTPFDPRELRYWLGTRGVDQYIGGIEHAILHLLYSRFLTKVLRDLGFVQLDEPFASLFTQGMVIKDGFAMSKSRGNVVDPDELIARYGADTVRLFCLFAAPPERDLDWSEKGVEGQSRFLNRVWRLVHALLPRLAPPGTPLPEPLSDADRELHRLTHHTIARVHEDLATRFHFNTAISAIHEHTAGLDAAEQASPPALREAIDALLLLLAPLVPHFAAELWEATGHSGALDAAAWPAADPAALVRDLVELPVQVNGKLRGRITVPADAPEGDVVAAALADAQVQGHLGGRPVKRQVVVPGRLVSLVV
jgi:leucyl-tRNA synthetase